MEKNQISPEQAAKQVSETFSRLESHRSEALVDARRLQEINNSAIAKECERIIKKYGNDHPRVEKIKNRLLFDKQLFGSLDKEIERSHGNKETFNVTDWRLHGRVYNKDNKTLQKHAVFLSDKNQQAIRDLPHACTDDNGYYSITVTEKLFGTIQDGKVYLVVSDGNQKNIYRGNETLTVIKGVIDYRDICVSEDECRKPNYDGEKAPD